ncbi:hypothetical protein VNO78_28847 [Psophocarpus tetragonolobus]|uniref:Uncharacterized protein n=1 Tax=Psophocarpus tetragonolobus TaxID=3891 RepID=A0AAN9WZI9_PSOTE
MRQVLCKNLLSRLYNHEVLLILYYSFMFYYNITPKHGNKATLVTHSVHKSQRDPATPNSLVLGGVIRNLL